MTWFMTRATKLSDLVQYCREDILRFCASMEEAYRFVVSIQEVTIALANTTPSK